MGHKERLKEIPYHEIYKELKKRQESPKKRRFANILKTGLIVSLLIDGTQMISSLQDNNSFKPLFNDDSETGRRLSSEDSEGRRKTFDQIKLISSKDNNPNLLSEDINQKELEVRDWTENYLSLLDDALSNLPPHFYAPQEKVTTLVLSKDLQVQKWIKEGLPEYSSFGWSYGKIQLEFSREEMQKVIDQIRNGDTLTYTHIEYSDSNKLGLLIFHRSSFKDEFVSLLKGQTSETGGVCVCGEENPTIGIMDDLNKNEFLSFMTHELTHYVTEQNDDHYKTQLFATLGVDNYEQFHNLFNSTPANNIYAKQVISTLKKHKLPLTSIGEGLSKAYYLNYGTTNHKEFIAVMSQFYIQGKQPFLETYASLVGKDKGDKLYEFMKSQIFLEKEYNN